MASEQTAERIMRDLGNGDIRRACNDQELNDDALLKVFRGITKEWKLTNEQRGALLGVSARTFQRWKSQTPHLTDEQLLRISYFLNMYLDFQAILDSSDETDTSNADTWIKQNIYDFGDRPPISIMTKGTLIDVYNVYSYVHAVATLWIPACPLSIIPDAGPVYERQSGATLQIASRKNAVTDRWVPGRKTLEQNYFIDRAFGNGTSAKICGNLRRSLVSSDACARI